MARNYSLSGDRKRSDDELKARLGASSEDYKMHLRGHYGPTQVIDKSHREKEVQSSNESYIKPNVPLGKNAVIIPAQKKTNEPADYWNPYEELGLQVSQENKEE